MILFALDITETMATALRIGAALVGFVIGWFVTKPVANVLSNLAFQRGVAPGLLPWIRALGGVGLAVLLYFIVPVGGYGPGPGGPGGGGKDKDKEKEKRDGKELSDRYIKDRKEGKEGVGPDKEARDLLRVEILGGKLYAPGSNRWYLLLGEAKDTAMTIDELKDAIKKRLEERKLKTARLQAVVTWDTLTAWRSQLLPEIEQLRKELNLTPVDPDESQKSEKEK
jgi:hypothetical protein